MQISLPLVGVSKAKIQLGASITRDIMPNQVISAVGTSSIELSILFALQMTQITVINQTSSSNTSPTTMESKNDDHVVGKSWKAR
jgi:hypothetical protein